MYKHIRRNRRLRKFLKNAVLIVIFVISAIVALSGIMEASDKNDRWAYICYDVNQPDMKYYYDSETVTYISDNQVGVWMKIADSNKKSQLLHLEISCASNMFHLMEDSVDYLWGSRIKTSYVAGRWIKTPPDSEVYLLSKLVCRNLVTSK
jgi:hypothetical protein